MADCWRMDLREIMSRRVITVNEDDTVEFVIHLFNRHHISGAPVMNSSGEYVGVISRTDLSGCKILDWVDMDCHLDSMLVREIMNPGKPCMISENAPVAEAVRLMMQKKIHRVFVSDEYGKIVGVMSSFDVLTIVDILASQDEAAHASTTNEEARTFSEPWEERSRRVTELESRIQALINKKRQECYGEKDKSMQVSLKQNAQNN